MFSWLKSPEPKEATWSEISQAYIEKFKCVTYSDIDREEHPVIYTNVPSIPVGGKGFNVDFDPISVLSSYYIQTHKGNTAFSNNTFYHFYGQFYRVSQKW